VVSRIQTRCDEIKGGHIDPESVGGSVCVDRDRDNSIVLRLCNSCGQ